MTISALRLAVRQESLPVPSKPQKPALQTVAPEIESCWSLKRRILHLSANRSAFPNMRAIFAMFRLQSAYNRAHRELQRQLRRSKRARTLRMLDQAEQAANIGNSRDLFGVLKLLCPKRSLQKVKLKDPEGKLLSAAEECDWLVQYARKLFSGTGFSRG